ncbi:MAG TPA: hypothetical protein VFD98_10105, partial [Terracidiphilus sp.]|nr:hypothetical protein [Terracidiphilus sp.]
MQEVIAGIAILVGIALGYWIRTISTKAEKALLEQRTRESAEALVLLQSQVAQAQAASVARAGFESLALEREKTIERLNAERDLLRTEQQTSHAAARTYAARISQLEADLKNERQNLAEKLALLDAAKKSLSDQFAALASDILDQKSKTFSEGSQKEIGTLLNPLRDQIKEFREKVE